MRNPTVYQSTPLPEKHTAAAAAHSLKERLYLHVVVVVVVVIGWEELGRPRQGVIEAADLV